MKEYELAQLTKSAVTKIQSPWDNYRPQTKLQEGNVLAGACLSFCSGEGVPMWPLPLMHWDMDTPPIPDMGPILTPWIPDMGRTPSPCY